MPPKSTEPDDEDDDLLDPPEDDPDGDDEDDEDDPDEGKTPEQLLAELKKTRAQAEKLSKQGGRRAGALKDARKRIAELEGKTEDDDDEDDDEDEDTSKAGDKARRDGKARGLSQADIDRAVKKAVERERKAQESERVRERISSKAETALAAAGVEGKSLRMLVKELDFDDLTLEKDGTIDGLDEAIDELKTDYPQLFRRRKGSRDRINGGDDRDGGKKRKLSVTERQVAGLR